MIIRKIYKFTCLDTIIVFDNKAGVSSHITWMSYTRRQHDVDA